MKLSIQAVPFSGFYYSEWDSLIQTHEENEKSWMIDRYGFDEDFISNNIEVTVEWRNKAEQEVADAFCNYYFELVSEHTGIDFSVESVKVISPKAYNFATDKLVATVSIKLSHKQLAEKVKRLIKENYQELKKLVESNHTSCDGFISFMTSDIDEWAGHIEDEDEELPYLDYILAYLTHLKAKEERWARSMGDNNFLNYAIYEAVAYNTNISAPEFKTVSQSYDDEWEEMLERMEAIDNHRKMLANHPVIPGL